MYKKILFSLGVLVLFFILNVSEAVVVNAEAPPGYKFLDWVGESGIVSYMKAPESAGYIDFVTIIDLSKNEIKLMNTPSRVYESPAVAPFENENVKNWLFPRSVVESLKTANPEAKFIWNAPFFNVEMSTTILSLGLKSTDAEGDYITSGIRPAFDMEEPRRMLIIDNKTKTASIADFDEEIFVNEGDQAVEGFDPLGSPSSKAGQASRVFLGVKNDGKELVVYCSKSASKEEASNGLLNAGVSVENQIQVDGGGSATCGYNLPGQYFVEPGRALPHLMGAFPVKNEGTIMINNLNVRSGPGTNNPAVRKLAIGTVVTMYEESNGWVRISNSEWVHGQYVKKIKSFPYSAKVNINQLNVRAGIGTKFSVTRRLEQNTEVNVQEEKDGWVRISDSEWVLGKFVE